MNLVHIDDKGRVVLPREARRSELYAVEVTEKGEITLRPRIAVDPNEVLTKETLAVLDESMQNLAKGPRNNNFPFRRAGRGQI